ILRLLPTSLIIISTIVLMSFRLPGLALLLLLYVIMVIAVSSTLVLRVAGPAQEAYANAQDRYGGHLAGCITGIFTTKSYAQEHREVERFAIMAKSLRAKNLEAYVRGNLTSFIQRLMMGGMLCLLLGGGTWYFIQGRANIDDIAYLVLAYTILQGHVRD